MNSIENTPRWWRDPLVHFLALGGVLFALDVARTSDAAGSGSAAGAPIVVSAAHVAELETALQRTGEPTTPADLDAEIERFVDEEVMVREARQLGLDRGDMIIRRRLVQKMRFVIEDMAAAEPPTDAEMAVWLAANRARYRRPARYDIEHAFFSSERRGDRAVTDAAEALEAWRSAGTEPGGDPFLGGRTLISRSDRHLRRGFGAAFADLAASAAAPDAWSGPVKTPFGQHLVRVTRVQPAVDPELAAVRARVRADIMDDRRRRASGRARAELRERYAVEIERAR